LVFSIFGKKPEKKPDKPAPPKAEARKPASPAQRGPAPASSPPLGGRHEWRPMRIKLRA